MLCTASSALLQQHCNMAAPEVEQAGREGGGGAVEGRGSEWSSLRVVQWLQYSRHTGNSLRLPLAP